MWTCEWNFGMCFRKYEFDSQLAVNLTKSFDIYAFCPPQIPSKHTLSNSHTAVLDLN